MDKVKSNIHYAKYNKKLERWTHYDDNVIAKPETVKKQFGLSISTDKVKTNIRYDLRKIKDAWNKYKDEITDATTKIERSKKSDALIEYDEGETIEQTKDKSLDEIAFQTVEGEWVAGSDLGEETGKPIDETKAKKLRRARQRRNSIASVMVLQDLPFETARDRIDTVIQKDRELQRQVDQNDITYDEKMRELNQYRLQRLGSTRRTIMDKHGGFLPDTPI